MRRAAVIEDRDEKGPPMRETARHTAAHDLFDEGEIRDVLEGTFYRPGEATTSGEHEVTRPSALAPLAVARPEVDGARRRRPAKPKPDHYEVICISLYKEDLERLDAKVAELKAAGHRRMTRSALIRWRLDHVDVDAIPRGI